MIYGFIVKSIEKHYYLDTGTILNMAITSYAAMAGKVPTRELVGNANVTKEKNHKKSPFIEGKIHHKEFSIEELQKINQKRSSSSSSSNTHVLCKSVYITRGDKSKVTFQSKTYMVQLNTSKNTILKAILEQGITKNGTYDFRNKKEPFDIETEDKGKFRCKVLAESATFVWLKQYNLHFGKGSSTQNLIPFNERGVWIFK